MIANKILMRWWIVIIILCVAPSWGQSQVRKQIEAADQKISDAIRRGDGAAMAALYTVDAKLMPPNSDFVSGAAQIQSYWQTAMDKFGLKDMELRIQEIYHHGNFVTEFGIYTVSDASGKQVDRGKYIVIWKKVDHQWKLHRDLWNSNLSQ